ncbi:hypothetical protein PPL_00566 [Heterostelium album PN500]|uniref:Uncharacterized protein n=1 Tax=Heterostelium pallidum (strain ATCC 26659 / Pp 5 / PN500) TaxID=670386 RepID=D3AWT8_HETP5|nr:hypothetical protein PPL_00566 [Heterostelium album PN500]EFA86761.1 hypothetical protein PPL_00566 [Heterostelium album PN500]|eukprot:XP_020438865.1 hypothetical protein PPL_00566 [Heterostelium album PN500]
MCTYFPHWDQNTVSRYPQNNIYSQCTFMDAIANNGGCPSGLIPYYKDGLIDPSAKTCGQCVPGISGLENPDQCGINEFCDDSGSCKSLKDHPLYHQSCPSELNGEQSATGWCGAGLKCIQHSCSICKEGSIFGNDGKQCINGEWSYSKWSGFRQFNDPTDTFVFWIFILLIVVGLAMAIVPRIDTRLFLRKGKKTVLSLKNSFGGGSVGITKNNNNSNNNSNSNANNNDKVNKRNNNNLKVNTRVNNEHVDDNYHGVELNNLNGSDRSE